MSIAIIIDILWIGFPHEPFCPVFVLFLARRLTFQSLRQILLRPTMPLRRFNKFFPVIDSVKQHRLILTPKLTRIFLLLTLLSLHLLYLILLIKEIVLLLNVPNRRSHMVSSRIQCKLTQIVSTLLGKWLLHRWVILPFVVFVDHEEVEVSLAPEVLL